MNGAAFLKIGANTMTLPTETRMSSSIATVVPTTIAATMRL